MAIFGPAAFAAALVDLVVPRGCAGCGRVGPAVCARCGAALAGDRPPLAGAVGPAALPTCAAAAVYEGPARNLVIAFKERGRLDLARPLGEALASAVVAAVGDPRRWALAVVPVPSRRSARSARGYDHVSLIARAAVGALRRAGVVALVAPALRPAGRAEDQVGLSAAARSANVAGTFAARPRAVPAGHQVVLVDDVLTTGATLLEAARTLAGAGVRARAVAVVAATPSGRARRVGGAGFRPAGGFGRGPPGRRSDGRPTRGLGSPGAFRHFAPAPWGLT